MADLVQCDSVRQVGEVRGVVVHVPDDQLDPPWDLQSHNVGA